MSDDPLSNNDSRKKFSRKFLEVPRDRLQTRRLSGDVGRANNAEESTSNVQRSSNRALEYQSVKGKLHERLIDEMNDQTVLAQPDEKLENFVNDFEIGRASCRERVSPRV